MLAEPLPEISLGRFQRSLLLPLLLPWLPPREGCGKLVWTSATLAVTQGTDATRVDTITLSSGEQVTVAVRKYRTGGQPGRKIDSGQQPTPNYGDFSATSAGSQKAWANGVTSDQSTKYVVPSGTTTSVLNFNQGTSSSAKGTTRGSETLTFSFASSTGKALTPVPISFNAYDITSQQANMNNAAYYTDQLSFSGATDRYGTAVGTPKTYVTTTTTTSTSSTETNTSTTSGNYIPITLKPSSATPSITYANVSTTRLVASSNFQYAGIGDVTICF
ncbi:hypothetical protein [Neomicrococcus lactis]|uniref:Uncharacterized protein n=1 Tax=Neomicrococcus lactis TaxID=732241 RepID=A0A7W8YAX0_9MICC|nr:hypothetical protein [Neomicrococcus lactis]MBB5598179.1 hypothetical protein [Neomicrococcus lactis]